MKIFPFRAVAPNLDKVPHNNDFFDTVKFRYHDYAAEGLFHPTEAEAMYIYQIKAQLLQLLKINWTIIYKSS